MCLSLFDINTEEQSFAEYVEGLTLHSDDEQGNFFKFESILRYARFPDLDAQNANKPEQDMKPSIQTDHTEIRMVIDWLRERGVKEILELSVPDRLFSSHSDDDVAHCVNGSAVRVLKWRKLDLYLGNLADKHHLRKLHLYSSGNRSVHDQWRRELPNFRKVGVHIRLVPNMFVRLKVLTAPLCDS